MKQLCMILVIYMSYFVYTPFYAMQANDEQCGICLQRLQECDILGLRCTPQHVHQFHAACLLQWIKIKNRCPLCKRKTRLSSLVRSNTAPARPLFVYLAREEEEEDTYTCCDIVLGAVLAASCTLSGMLTALVIPSNQ